MKTLPPFPEATTFGEIRDEVLYVSAPIATETRDDVLRRSVSAPRATDTEVRRLYEPAPSPALRVAAADAVNEFFVSDMCRRLDRIAEIARELGGAVGAEIRELAGMGSSAPDGTTRTRPVVVTVTEPIVIPPLLVAELMATTGPILVDFADHLDAPRSSGHPMEGADRTVSKTGEVLEFVRHENAGPPYDGVRPSVSLHDAESCNERGCPWHGVRS